MSRPVIALAGNPNVGKSTLFNRLTGLRQHTGNWAGKTVALARGRAGDYELVDLPGVYSLLARSKEEELARDYLSSGEPDAVAVVCDATCLQRSLVLALEVMELCPRVLIVVNLLDEAKRKGLTLDLGLLERRLGVPVLGLVARRRESKAAFLAALPKVLEGSFKERLTVDYPEGAAVGWKAETEGEELTQSALWRTAGEIAREVQSRERADDRFDRRLDRLLLHRLGGTAALLCLLSLVLYLTVKGANLPSEALGRLLYALQGRLAALLSDLGAPAWLEGLLIDGVWAVSARVVSVMLPPMAIFFPLFTLLEELGYLPRAAYHLDGPFSRCGSCGKQCLTMCMGLGCNAVGVTGCRILETGRERRLAVLTNALVPCNGRFPTLIAMLSLLLGGGSLLTAFGLTAALLLSLGLSLLMTWLLSKTLMRGEPSRFVLELPPYRRPQLIKLLLRSVLDRTLFVLGRALAVAAPAGAALWGLSQLGALPRLAAALEPFGRLLGLDGVLLLAFLLGSPANEIVLPLALMLYAGTGALTEPASLGELYALLSQNGFTAKTAVCTALFMLFHWPCATTLLTVKKETGSLKDTLLAAALPTALGLVLCAAVNALWGC